MNLRTATPPRVAQRSAACCSGGRVHPQMILLFVVLKVCFFWQTVGLSAGSAKLATHARIRWSSVGHARRNQIDRVTNSAETMRRIDRQPLREWKHRELIDEP